MYMMFNKFGLLNTYYPIILPGLLFGFGIILTKQYFDKLPNSLREAAQIDGAGEIRTFVQIFFTLNRSNYSYVNHSSFYVQLE